MLSVLLASVIREKTGQISSVENDRPITLASIPSKALEQILLDRLQEYTISIDNEFGFKNKYNTDLYTYALN